MKGLSLILSIVLLVLAQQLARYLKQRGALPEQPDGPGPSRQIRQLELPLTVDAASGTSSNLSFAFVEQQSTPQRPLR
jgi:hypothetical protein